MSPRPPVSLGGDHSKVTQVSFTVVIGFSGADGGPEGSKKHGFVSVYIFFFNLILKNKIK